MRGISFTNYFLQLVDLSNNGNCANSHHWGQPELAAAQTEDFIQFFVVVVCLFFFVLFCFLFFFQVWKA